MRRIRRSQFDSILDEPKFVTLVVDDRDGRRVRNLVSETWFPAGDNVAWWDGINDLFAHTDAARHGIYRIPAQFVEPGEYHVRGLTRKPIDLRFEFSVYSAGDPAWNTADHRGAWLANHSPPSSVLFVPADKAPGGKPLVFLGSYVSEGTDGLAWVDLDGHKMGGEGWVGGNWTGRRCWPAIPGPHAIAGIHGYACSAFEGELRITALTDNGDRPVLKYNLPGGKGGIRRQAAWRSMMESSYAAFRSRSNCCSSMQTNGKILGTAPCDDPADWRSPPTGNCWCWPANRCMRYRAARS